MSLCILTNATTLFPPTSSASVRYIRNMPLGMNDKGLLLPGIEIFNHIYNELEREFKAILVLTTSDGLYPVTRTAQLAAQCHGGIAQISVLNSMQIGPGVGILAQLAARKAATGTSLTELEEYIRSLMPHMFTLIYPEKVPLYQEGNNGQPHEPAGEQKGLATLFLLEDGQLTPYKKVRTQRHLLENLQEFIGEFEKPQHLAYFHGNNASQHTRALRETASSMFPGAHFNDLDLNQELITLLGEHTAGLTILEVPGIGWV